MIKQLNRFLKDKLVHIIFATVLIAISVIISLKAPLYLAKATDTLVIGMQKSNIDYATLYENIYKVILIQTTVIIFLISENALLFSISTTISYNIKKEINEKINRLSIGTLDKDKIGSLMSLMVNDVETFTYSIQSFLTYTLPGLINIVGVVIYMFSLSITLTIIVLIFLPISFLTLGFIAKKSQKYFKEVQEKLAKLNANIEETYSNQDIIKSFNAENISFESFSYINNELFKVSIISQFFSGIMMPIITTLTNVNFVIISFVASLKINAGLLSFGKFQAFIQYLNSFHPNLSSLSQVMMYYQSLKATTERISEFLDKEEMEDDSNKNIDIEKIKGNISFENVSFSYNKDKKVLKNLNFDIKAGQKVAIVGHTGSGKTTIINLLMKFYNIDSGSIKIDGIDIKNISRKSISQIFTMVLQDTWLFKGSIKDNISFGSNKDNVSLKDIKEASKKANSHHFIKTLEKGYNTLLDESVNNISEGQKQQLTIARAFLKESKILILDEATSSIDSRTEKLIQESTKEMMKDKTSLIIAHRLSTIKDCDLIIVFENGEILEIGSHEELLSKNGAYKKLYTS